MAEVLTQEFFASPLTEALFDRTPEQRQATAKALAIAYKQGQPATTILERNAIFFEQFANDLNVAIEARFEDQTHEALGTSCRNAPSFDPAIGRLAARQSVLADLEVLHQALPIPSLERLS